MAKVGVQIVRLVDDYQPGWVACELMDATGRRHTLVDEVPVFTAACLHEESMYPQRGVVACEVISRWQDGEGRGLVRIDIANPCGVASVQGITEFVVLAEQVIEGGE